MAVLPRRALHEQLSVIMGALTKAAVAEICEAVDEGYAALQMEITRSHKENDDLKKKLHLIESIVVRGGGGGGGGGGGTAAEPGGARRAETPQRRDADGGGGVTAVVRDELPDVVLIKDEDSDTSDSFEEGKKPGADGGAAADREAVASTPISRSSKRRWPGSEAGDRKSSSEQGTPKRNVSVYTLDSPRGEAGEAVCSCATQMDPDVQLVHQESPPLPPSQAAYFGNSALMEAQSGPEQDLGLTWTRASKGQVTFGQFHQNENPDGDAFGIRLISVSGSASTDAQPSESSGSAFEYESSDVMSFYRDQPGPPQPGGRGKRFVCSICSRTYATSQNLDVHMRIHTGERPFSCDQCGKKFTQSAHLKSHLSVHSGERPYACAVCARSFIVKYSLKLHMRKCHPDVPSQ